MSSPRVRKRWGLMASITCIVVIWIGILPLLSATQTVKERERWLDEQGIDPAAMFYTELPLLESSWGKPKERGMQPTPGSIDR